MPEQTNPSQPISSYQLVRWARQERSALMAAYLRSAAAYLAASLGGLRAILWRVRTPPNSRVVLAQRHPNPAAI